MPETATRPFKPFVRVRPKKSAQKFTQLGPMETVARQRPSTWLEQTEEFGQVSLAGSTPFIFGAAATQVVAFYDPAFLLDHIKDVSMQMAEVKNQLSKLQDQLANLPFAYCTFIATLGASGLELKKPIPITIREDGDGFIASFVDANIATGGDTAEEAVADLQSLIVSYFEDLEVADDSDLGPSMLKTKRVLLETVCRV